MPILSDGKGKHFQGDKPIVKISLPQAHLCNLILHISYKRVVKSLVILQNILYKAAVFKSERTSDVRNSKLYFTFFP